MFILFPQSVSQLPYGKALYTYEGKEPGDLKFNKGDIIILRRKVDENWYHGELNGNHGFFPASYIQCIKPLPQAPPQGKALYDFEIKDKDQDKDCLTFTKDEILTVIRRVDDNWAEGMLGDKIGIFPILYVELNESAKQLMEMDKTCSAAASGCDMPLATETVAVAAAAAVGLAPCSTLAGAGVAGAAQRQVEGKKNAKKRHSFTALSMTHKSSQAASNRHSMEISAPVLISSSDPRAAARIGDLTHLSSSAPAQVRWGGGGVWASLAGGTPLCHLFQNGSPSREVVAQCCHPDVT
ncbi:E3 ubiquitin-protein ligase SH3RF3-like, partial [Corvus kubaryi]|uniref:E3 ubiquitin-protein ligase SH3RF3-like n=1 Tax=Corvus kubaryi TaxID=68294 RepID=UPI001C051144